MSAADMDSSDYISAVALNIINNLPDEKPYHNEGKFFESCMAAGFNKDEMISQFLNKSSPIFNPDNNRLIHFMSLEELRNKKYRIFNKMHTKVLALAEAIDKKLLVSLPSIVVNKPRVVEQNPHYDFDAKNQLDSRNSYSLFGVICSHTKLIAWIEGTFTHIYHSVTHFQSLYTHCII
jgi:hypothetical protein